MRYLLPDFIYRQFSEKVFSGKISANVMLIDIIGFTSMTERFMQFSKAGAENLSDYLNEMYKPIIRIIHGFQGEIMSFAGDSLLVLFSGTKTPAEIKECAVLIEENFSRIKEQLLIKENIPIGIKIGLSYGQNEWYITGRENHYQYFFKSQAINNANKAQSLCSDMDIIAHKSFVKLLMPDHNSSEDFINLKKTDNIQIEISDQIRQSLTTDYADAEVSKTHDKSTEKMIQKTNELFFPVININSLVRGEFRYIACLFISIKADLELFLQTVHILLELSDTYGGYFNKIDLVDNQDTALLIFGAPVSYENNVYRAQFLLTQFKQIVNTRFTDENTGKVKIKAGISCGSAYAGFVGSALRSEYTCLGDTVNVAARLCALADWNTFLVSREVSENAKNWFQYDEKSSISIKGKKQKLSVYSLRDSYVKTDEFYENAFSGREKELKFLSKNLLLLDYGKAPNCIYIYGDPGVGKSRLIFEMINQEKGKIHFIHLYTDNIIKNSLNPVISWLNKYFKIDQVFSQPERSEIFEINYQLFLKQLLLCNDSRKKEFHKEFSNKSELFKSLLSIETDSPLIKQISPKDLYEITSYTLKRFYLALSLIQKTCIILEDLQYIDNDTEKLLYSICQNSSNFPLMFIITSRFNDDGSKIPFIPAELTVLEVPLSVFTSKELKKMLENQIQGNLSRELADLIKEKSGSNPFYIEQLCSYLLENNLLDNKNSKIVLKADKIEIPGNINALIVSRIDRLSQDLKEIIQVASVIGREVDVLLLNDMLSQIYHSSDSFENLYSDIEKQQVWTLIKQLKYIFRHVLIQEAIYDMQLRQRLRQLHQYCALSLERLYAKREEYYLNIGWHYEKAEIFEKAKEYYILSGDYLSSRYLNSKALETYDKAIDLELENLEYLSVLEKKIKIYNFIAMKNEENRYIQEGLILSKSIDSKYYLMRYLARFGDFNRSISNYDEALDSYEKALQIAREINELQEEADITGFIGLIYMYRGKYDQALSCYEFKIKVCRELNDMKGVAYTTNNIGVIYLRKSRFDQALQCYETLKALSEENNDKFGEILALGNIGLIWYNKGDLDKSEECFLKEIRICREIGDVNRISNAYNNLGNVYWSKDELQKALKYYELDKENCEIRGDKLGLAYAVGNMGLIHYTREDYQKAIKSFRYWAEKCEEFQDYNGLSNALTNLSQIYLAINQIDQAEQVLEKSRQICEKIGDESQLGTTISDLGNVYYYKGEIDKAIECYLFRLKNVQKTGEKISYLNCYENLALFYAFLSNFEEAERYYDLSLAEASDLNNDKRSFIVITNYLKFKLETNRDCDYHFFINQAEEILNRSNDKAMEFELSFIKASFLALNHPDEGVRLLEEMTQNVDYKVLHPSIYYRLWIITQRSDFQKKALKLYTECYRTNPYYQNKVMIDRLQSVVK